MMRNEDSRCQLARRAWKQHSESCCVPGDRGFWLAVQVGGGSWIQGADIGTLCFSLLRLTLIASGIRCVFMALAFGVCLCYACVCICAVCMCV